MSGHKTQDQDSDREESSTVSKPLNESGISHCRRKFAESIIKLSDQLFNKQNCLSCEAKMGQTFWTTNNNFYVTYENNQLKLKSLEAEWVTWSVSKWESNVIETDKEMYRRELLNQPMRV